MHKPFNRSSPVVDRSQVLTLRKVLNDLSAVLLVTGRDKKISYACVMLRKNILLRFSKSIISILWHSFFAINYTKFHFQLTDFLF